jgi:hypothetical protein
MRTGPKPIPVYDRLMAKTTVHPSGCLEWTGAGVGDGYGGIRIGSQADGTRKMESVHRVAWMLAGNPLTPGMELDHVKDRGCITKRCWNVLHLQEVTHKVNTGRRGHNCSPTCQYHHRRA